MSKETRALVVRATESDDFQISLNGEFNLASEKAIAIAADVKLVNSEATQGNAITAIQSLDNAMRFLEKSREEVKKPFWDTGKEIDRLAKEAKAPLETEANRVRRLVSEFQRAEADRVRQEEMRQQALIRAEQAKIDELERQRIEAERKAAELKSKPARDRVAAEAARLEDEKTRLELAASMTPPVTVVMPAVISGAKAKTKYRVEIMDINALYKAHPNCVKLEPKLSEINNLVEMGMRNIPGVKLTEELAIETRSPKAQNYQLR